MTRTDRQEANFTEQIGRHFAIDSMVHLYILDNDQLNVSSRSV